MQPTIAEVARPGAGLSQAQVEEVVCRACLPEAYRGKRVLLIVPDGTRTAPIGLVFRALHRRLA